MIRITVEVVSNVDMRMQSFSDKKVMDVMYDLMDTEILQRAIREAYDKSVAKAKAVVAGKE